MKFNIFLTFFLLQNGVQRAETGAQGYFRTFVTFISMFLVKVFSSLHLSFILNYFHKSSPIMPQKI